MKFIRDKHGILCYSGVSHIGLNGEIAVARFSYHPHKPSDLPALYAHYVAQAAALVEAYRHVIKNCGARYETDAARLLGKASFALRQAANVDWWIRENAIKAMDKQQSKMKGK